jgi:hypothetical protein
MLVWTRPLTHEHRHAFSDRAAAVAPERRFGAPRKRKGWRLPRNVGSRVSVLECARPSAALESAARGILDQSNRLAALEVVRPPMGKRQRAGAVQDAGANGKDFRPRVLEMA